MTGRERRAAEAVIEWAVAPAAPLPAVRETDAVAAFGRSLDAGPRLHRCAARGLLTGLELLGRCAPDSRRAARAAALARLERGRLASLGDLLAALAHLAYYG